MPNKPLSHQFLADDELYVDSEFWLFFNQWIIPPS